MIVGTNDLVLTKFHHDWVGMDAIDAHGQRYMQSEWDSKLFPRELGYERNFAVLTTSTEYGGSVALSKDYAGKLGLQGSITTVEDPEKMHYLIAGYHQLHCAVSRSFTAVICEC